MNIGLIVEGHGDAIATPALLRRVAVQVGYFDLLTMPKPFRLSRGRMVKQHELMRAVEFVSRQVGPDGVVFVIFDADDDCPVQLAGTIRPWLDERQDIKVRLVVSDREFECWYIASAEALQGVRGLANTAACPANPDIIRDGKGWLASRMPNGYSETIDQAAFASKLDIAQAVRSRSFRKFLKEFLGVLGVPAPAGLPRL